MLIFGGKTRGPTTHGSARWGDAKEANRAGKLAPVGSAGGLMLGRLPKGLPGKRRDLRYRADKHVVTSAPTRAGKGIGCAIPNLLEYPGSVLVVDVKGENFAVTAKRRMQMGHEVWVIDPFGLTGRKSHRMNWLDCIDLDSPDCISEALALAEALIVRSPQGESYWDDQAQWLLQGLMLHVASLPKRGRHLGTVRDLLTVDEPKLLGLFEELGKDRTNAMLSRADRERSGILSTAQRHTAFLDDPRVVNALRSSGFRFERLSGKPTSTYLVIHPDRLSAYSRLVRAYLTLALRAVVRKPNRSKHNVLFLLDEFGQLGYLSEVESRISLVGGYGVWLWLFVQDLSQLKAVYPKWRTFLGNAVLQAFGSQDQDTTRYVSEALGRQTIRVETEGTSSSHNWHSGGSSGESRNFNHKSRELLTPDEVRKLSAGQVIVLEQGQPPYLLKRLNYLDDRESRGFFAPNPMHSRGAA